jgi:hypothetical protein
MQSVQQALWKGMAFARLGGNCWTFCRIYSRDFSTSAFNSFLHSYRHPTLLWFNSSDTALLLHCWSGVILSILIMLSPSFYFLWWPLFILNVSLHRIGGYYSPICPMAMYNIYPRPFVLQTEPLQCETAFLAAVASMARSFPYAQALIFRWFIFRMMFSAGTLFFSMNLQYYG